tara:strand:- start:778 stop:1185 length:408 start_codon:yes stop_codon:yes gene_type:complete
MYSLKDVKFINFKTFNKKNELLTAYTGNDNVPFNLKRMFLTGSVKKNSSRGSHAHKKTSQIFICLYGKIDIRCFDGKKTKTYKLTDQSLGIFIPPTIWYDTLYKGKNNSIMVLTDKKYLINDYILTKKEYLSFKK